MVLEALRAAEALDEVGVSAEVIDLRTVRPWDAQTVLSSVERTRRLVVTDTGWSTGGFSAEVVAHVAESGIALDAPPRRVCLPDMPTPTSPALAANYYPRAAEVAAAAAAVVGVTAPQIETPPDQHLDVPDPTFAGPF
jgi:pyruvate dehydrogenase E1 component beta subunit